MPLFFQNMGQEKGSQKTKVVQSFLENVPRVHR